MSMFAVLLLSASTAVAFQPSSSSLHYLQTQRTTRPSIVPAVSFFELNMARGPPRRRYQPIVKEVKPVMNDEIEAKELRVVTPSPKGKDEILGIMTREEALQRASDMGGLDLILVNNNSDPPVCKIVDYSKYRYMQEKKAKEVKKNSKASELKEVKMSYKIDVHDYAVRKTSASKFLKQGNRVKCTVMFRGREVQHDALGFDLLAKLASELEETCVTEGRPKREGRNLSLILTPRPEVLKKVNEQRRAMDKAKKQKKLEQQRAEANGEVVVAADDDDDDEDVDDDDDDDDEFEEAHHEEQQAPHKTKAEKTLEELLGDDYL